MSTLKPIMYLASPYTHLHTEIQHMRYLAVRDTVAHLMRNGVLVFSPILHCHPLAVSCGLKGDINFWREYDFAMIAALPQFGILRLPGWRQSGGIEEEKAYALSLDRVIESIFPHSIYADLLQLKAGETACKLSGYQSVNPTIIHRSASCQR